MTINLKTATKPSEHISRKLTIAHQNNAFRNGLVCARSATAAATFGVKGMLVLTRGVHSQGHEFTQKALAAVAAFDNFTEENNPHGECDFGSLVVEDIKLFWKIDLYNNAMDAGSEEPENPKVTHRVLTILLPSEY